MQMTTNDQNNQEQILRYAFRTMDGNQAQTIRDAYYKAVEGLNALADALEIGDLQVGERNDHALIQEHLLACEALESMGKSLLGRIV